MSDTVSVNKYIWPPIFKKYCLNKYKRRTNLLNLFLLLFTIVFQHLFTESGTKRNELPNVYKNESYMFLNPWYSGQPSGGPALEGTRGPPEDGHPPSSPSPEEVPHPTYSSDPGQDLIVEQANLSDDQLRQLATVQQSLRPGWTVHLTTEGRFYYCNHYNQTR